MALSRTATLAVVVALAAMLAPLHARRENKWSPTAKKNNVLHRAEEDPTACLADNYDKALLDNYDNLTVDFDFLDVSVDEKTSRLHIVFELTLRWRDLQLAGCDASAVGEAAVAEANLPWIMLPAGRQLDW